jgi:predicted Zn-ribbon and HTH transcriptional regulator
MGGFSYDGSPEYHTYYPDGEMDKKVLSVVEHFPRDYMRKNTEAVVEKPQYCEYCGTLFEAGRNRCDSCGAPQRKVSSGT